MWISKGFPARVNDSLQAQIFGPPDQFTEPGNGKVKITVRPGTVRTVGAKEGALVRQIDLEQFKRWRSHLVSLAVLLSVPPLGTEL